jgi:hypothetical protein
MTAIPIEPTSVPIAGVKSTRLSRIWSRIVGVTKRVVAKVKSWFSVAKTKIASAASIAWIATKKVAVVTGHFLVRAGLFCWNVIGSVGLFIWGTLVTLVNFVTGIGFLGLGVAIALGAVILTLCLGLGQTFWDLLVDLGGSSKRFLSRSAKLADEQAADANSFEHRYAERRRTRLAKKNAETDLQFVAADDINVPTRSSMIAWAKQLKIHLAEERANAMRVIDEESVDVHEARGALMYIDHLMDVPDTKMTPDYVRSTKEFDKTWAAINKMIDRRQTDNKGRVPSITKYKLGAKKAWNEIKVYAEEQAA